MKRFLVFCTICIVTACLGLMVYRFMTLEETLSVNQTVFEINIGDKVPLEVERKNEKGTTIVHYESLNEDVVYYDQTLGEYYATALGGKATLRISANIEGFTPILISVTVGNGSQTSPFFIKDAVDFANIGVEEELEGGEVIVKRPLDKAYSLISDIDMALYNEGEWQPVGSLDKPFTGTLFGNDHVIYNLKATNNEQGVAGLFAKLGSQDGKTGTIQGKLTFENADINGSFDYAGLVAGVNAGKIERIEVNNSSIVSTKDNTNIGLIAGYQTGSVERVIATNSSVYSENASANVGGLVGQLKTESSIRAQLSRSYAKGVNVTGNNNVGGLVGFVNGGVIIDCYSATLTEGEIVKGEISAVNATTNTSVGGLAGKVSYVGTSIDAIVMDSYSASKINSTAQKTGVLIGYSVDENRSESKVNRLQGLYYDSVNGLFGIGYVNGSVINSQSLEQSNYQYVYNNLTEEATELKVFKSHEDYSNSITPVIYNWPLGEIWFLNGGLPELDVYGAYYDYSDRLNTITNKEDIRTLTDLMRVYDDLSGNYVLRADLDLSELGADWQPIGTENEPFTGTFTCETDENGNPLWKITGLKFTASAQAGIATANEGKSAFFGVIGTNAKVSNIVIENPSIANGQKVAGIVAVNNGVVRNCHVVATNNEAKISTNNNSYKYNDGTKDVVDNNVYIAGIVAINYGIVDGCSVKGIKIVNANAVASTTYYIAGIVASSTGTVQNSKALKVSGTPSVVEVIGNSSSYVAGIVASNNGLVSKSSVTIAVKSAYENSKAFVGGVVAINEKNATLETSYANANIDGSNVGGVVGITYGLVSQCYSAGSITAQKVGGIAYSVADNQVNNCYTTVHLMGAGNGSVKCGLAYSVALINKNTNSASMRNCFSAVSFDGTGKNYFDSASEVRKDDQWVFIAFIDRDSGWLIDCIFDRTVGGDATRSNYNRGFDSFPWRDCQQVIDDYNKNSDHKHRYDTGLTTEEIMSTEGANVFRTYGYSEDIWLFEEGQYPKLKNVAA